MSLAIDSPVNSSSSWDDFTALLDAELESALSHDDDSEFVDRTKDEGTKDSCSHPKSFKYQCAVCWRKIDGSGSLPFRYIHKDLRISYDEISRLREDDTRTSLHNKKLYLVLDLDHTLLNSTQLEDLTPVEDYLQSRTDSLKGNLFQMDRLGMMTKLRPYVRSFLQEASKLFEMYIYTMGTRDYANEMVKLLDPENLYFDSRVLSQEDCTQRHQKGLDVILAQDSAVLILDDSESVWQKHKDNLILMERYHFFSSSCREFHLDCKSLSELKRDENEQDGALATTLRVLKRVHARFFYPGNGDDYATRDVRQVLTEVRKEVLRDCEIVFSRVFAKEMVPQEVSMWKIAEQLGAKCSTNLSASITHVVSLDFGTETSHWAVREGKFLVHPRWLEAARFLWQRQPENKFPVPTTKIKSRSIEALFSGRHWTLLRFHV